jgi:multidrug transporter EmrE-like cation transporter
MKLILGMLVGVLAQTLTFLQLQGRWKYEWMRDHQWVMVLLGIPISMLFMTSVSLMVQHFDGQLWPSRLIGFVIGTVMFTVMSVSLFGEPITIKTAICLVLSFMILMVQLFWK